jgi:mycothiol synthase
VTEAAATDAGRILAGRVRAARPGDEERLREIMLAVLATDAPPGTTAVDVERALDRLAGDRAGTLVSLDGSAIAGYVTPAMDDLGVDPAFRRRGHGRALVAAARDLVRSRGLDRLQLWVPHDGPGRLFAEALGFRYESSMWLLRLANGTPVPPAAFGPEVVVRLVRPGLDEPAQVELINACFVGHPSPVSVTEEFVRHVQALPGFDASGVLLAAAADQPDRLVGFCRTEMLDGDGKRRGVVGLVGVLPEWRGRGLGRELLRWGIAHLRRLDAGSVELSVEARNELALSLYLRTGFEPAIEWPHWALPA